MAPTGLVDLTPEALDEIARRTGPLDNVACSAVCGPWRRALNTTRLHLLKRPNQPHHVYVERRCECPLQLRNKRICNSAGTEPEPWIEKVCLQQMDGTGRVGVALESKTDSAVHPTRIIGSSYGWVITVDEACSLTLLEPLTGRRFPLPSITSSLGRSKQFIENVDQMGQDMFHKAALAPGRRLGTYAVILIHNGGYGLSFLKPGAECWTALHPPTWAPRNYQDVVLHKGVFYTVSVDSELNAWVRDGSVTGLRASLVARPQTQPVWAVLVESTARDDLLMASTPNTDGRRPHSSSPFEVSRYDEHKGGWTPYVDRGDMKILVKDNISLCVSRPPLSTLVDYSSDPLSYARCGCSLWRYGALFQPYVAPEFHHY